MKKECFTCGKTSENKKDFFELSGQIGPKDICKECAHSLGIKNFMSAGFHNNTTVLKKYVKKHPEAQFRLDAQLERLGKGKQQFKSELKQIVKDTHDRAERKSHKKMEQIKCTCNSCGNVYYWGNHDLFKNAINAIDTIRGNIYAFNQLEDIDKCPKCGSRATTKEKSFYWIDKNGNYIETEE